MRIESGALLRCWWLQLVIGHGALVPVRNKKALEPREQLQGLGYDASWMRHRMWLFAGSMNYVARLADDGVTAATLDSVDEMICMISSALDALRIAARQSISFSTIERRPIVDK